MNEEEFIAKLKETAATMQADGIDPSQIQSFIDQKKSEWTSTQEGNTNATAEETVPVVAEAADTELQSVDGSLEFPEKVVRIKRADAPRGYDEYSYAEITEQIKDPNFRKGQKRFASVEDYVNAFKGKAQIVDLGGSEAEPLEDSSQRESVEAVKFEDGPSIPVTDFTEEVEVVQGFEEINKLNFETENNIDENYADIDAYNEIGSKSVGEVNFELPKEELSKDIQRKFVDGFGEDEFIKTFESQVFKIKKQDIDEKSSEIFNKYKFDKKTREFPNKEIEQKAQDEFEEYQIELIENAKKNSVGYQSRLKAYKNSFLNEVNSQELQYNELKKQELSDETVQSMLPPVVGDALKYLGLDTAIVRTALEAGKGAALGLPGIGAMDKMENLTVLRDANQALREYDNNQNVFEGEDPIINGVAASEYTPIRIKNPSYIQWENSDPNERASEPPSKFSFTLVDNEKARAAGQYVEGTKRFTATLGPGVRENFDTLFEAKKYIGDRLGNLSDETYRLFDVKSDFDAMLSKIEEAPTFTNEKGEYDYSKFTKENLVDAIGTTATQMLLARFTLGLSSYSQEVGGIFEQVLEGKAIEKYGEEFLALSEDEKVEKYLQLTKNGEVNYNDIRISGTQIASLDLLGSATALNQAKKIDGSLLRNLIKRNWKGAVQESKALAVNTLKGGLTEVPTESAQELISSREVNKQLYGMEGAYITSDQIRSIKEVGLQSLVGVSGTVASGNVASRGIRSLKRRLATGNTKAILNDSKEALKDIDIVYESSVNQVNKKLSSAEISKSEANAELKRLKNSRDNQITALYKAQEVAVGSKYKNYESEAREESLNLMVDNLYLNEKINDIDADADKAKATGFYSKDDFDGRKQAVKDKMVDNEIERQIIDAKQNYLYAGSQMRDFVNNNPDKFNNATAVAFETKQEAEEYFKRRFGKDFKPEGRYKQLLDGNVFGFYDPDKNLIIDVKENLFNQGNGNRELQLYNARIGSNVVYHEGGHALMSVMEDSELASIKEGLEDFMANSLDPAISDVYASVKGRELTQKNKKPRVINEEFIASVSDALREYDIKNGDVATNAGLSKLGTLISGKLSTEAPSGLSFKGLESGIQTLEFIKKYNAFNGIIEPGSIKTKAATPDGEEKERLISDEQRASEVVKEVKFEEDSINEQFKAFTYDGKKNTAPESFQAEAAMAYEPLAQAVVDRISKIGLGVSKEQDQFIMDYLADNQNKQDIVSDLTFGTERNKASSLLGLAKSYNPEVGSFGGYAKSQLANRAIRILEERVGKQVTQGAQTIDAPESREVAAADQKTEVADTRSVFEKFNLKPSLKNKADSLVELGILNVEKKLKGQTLSNAKKISARTKGLSDVYKKIAPDVKKTIGKGKDFDNFLDSNWENIGNAYIDNVAVSKGRGGGISPFSEGFTKKDIVDYFKGNDLIVGQLNKNDKPLTKDQKIRTVSTRKTRSLPEAISRQIANESLKDYVANDPEINEQFQKDYGFALASKVLKDLRTKDQTAFDDLSNALKQIDNDYLNNNSYKWGQALNNLGIGSIFEQIYGETRGKAKFNNLVEDFEKEFSSMEKVEPTFEYNGQKYTLAGFITDKILSEIENDSYALQVEAITGRKLKLDWGNPDFISQIQESYSRIGKRMGKEWVDRFLSKGLKAPSKIGNGTLAVDENFNLVFSGEAKSTNRFGIFRNTEHYNTWVDSQNFPSKPISAYPFRAASAKPYKDKKGKIVWSKEDRTEEGIKAIQLSGISDNKAFIDLIDAIKEEGIGIDETVGLLMSMNNNPLGLTRRSAILDFMPTKEFEGQYLLEHMTPALVINLAALDYIHNKKSSTSDFKKLMQTYRTAQIPKKYDDIVNEYYKSHMPFYFKPGDVSIVRYYNPEIGERFNLKLKTLSTGTVIDKTYYKDNSKQEKSQSESLAVFDLDDKVLASKILDKDFNKMLEGVKGVKAEARYSEARANKLAGNKGKFKFFVPYSAEDYMGLIYPTLGKGKEGDKNLEWYKNNIIKPFAKGISDFESAKQRAVEEWRTVKKGIKGTPTNLKKEAVRGFTNEEAVRVFLWDKAGVVPDSLSKKDTEALVDYVNADSKLKSFADSVSSIIKDSDYPAPEGDWLAGTLTTDIINFLNTSKRADFLQEWQDNVDVVYSKDNMNKLKALYGSDYVDALENMLYAMKTGRNRPAGTTKKEKMFLNWINDSVGTVMFFNTRSAVLQTISSINFLNWSDNNPVKAAAAFANQPQYWKDFSMLFNSDFLKQRRGGLKNDVNADEIASAAANSTNKARAVISSMLKAGFLPTQIADSFAIAAGGSTFYRNRLNTYLKDGMSQEEANQAAMLDWQESAEESQQSSRPDKVSMEQRSSLGRLVLAFANTPMQYTRLVKKASLDLINGRGDWKTNVSKLLYYGAVQNIIFTALQQALFAMSFDDDEEEVEAATKVVNGIADTLLRGSGVYGAGVATMKNIIMEAIRQSKSKRTDYTKAALKLTTLSPPIDTKLRKLMSAGRSFTYSQSKKDMREMGVDVNNPAALAVGQIVSALGNVPVDRAVQKLQNLKEASNQEREAYEQIFLALGWSKWSLGIKDDKSTSISSKKAKPGSVNPSRKNRRKGKGSFYSVPTKRLERGEAGKAHRDGTIELAPDLSPIEREKTIVHEQQHIKDMNAGRLDYDDNYLYWNGKKYERKNGKIKYNGKWLIEGHKSLPWEKKAYDAEPTTQEIKKRKKLY